MHICEQTRNRIKYIVYDFWSHYNFLHKNVNDYKNNNCKIYIFHKTLFSLLYNTTEPLHCSRSPVRFNSDNMRSTIVARDLDALKGFDESLQ